MFQLVKVTQVSSLLLIGGAGGKNCWLNHQLVGRSEFRLTQRLRNSVNSGRPNTIIGTNEAFDKKRQSRWKANEARRYSSSAPCPFHKQFIITPAGFL